MSPTLLIRFVEDALIVSRFVYFLKKGPDPLPPKMGFAAQTMTQNISCKDRVKWAWGRTFRAE